MPTRSVQDLVENYLVIQRVEPGALYLSGGTGPLDVSESAPHTVC